MCWCAIPRSAPPPLYNESGGEWVPAFPATLYKVGMADAARAQHLARIAKTLAEHGSLPYLGRTHMAFFLVGSGADARVTLRLWGIDPDAEEVSFVLDEVAEGMLGHKENWQAIPI